MKKPQNVVVFGELLMRLDASHSNRFVQAENYQASFTGGEANVAVALAQWGIVSSIVSRVPSHSIGQACVNHFRRYGVRTESVLRGGDRLGLFFVESPVPPRSGQVIYDRDATAFRTLQPGDIDWDLTLADADWFHFTGTAPANGENVREVLAEGIQTARKRGVTISFDCGYRSQLWTIEEAAKVLPRFMEMSDVFIGSEHDARTFFDVHSQGTESLRDLSEKYTLKTVAYTDRNISSLGMHRYQATIHENGKTATSRIHEVTPLDRIGTGDAFTAGLVLGQLQERSLQSTVEFATAAAALTHSIHGDFALLSIDEIEGLANGDSIGRIRR
ncbi:sugar kinase [Thalassoroseus pseudoceratinae]|uniref:sugar kinase n=1 Tax=Thalassoroseus pseudoceratinae TaxID=2713176 RepID=UPI00142261F7|nr:sugar kinase [Thalassoroseus pseudoceratinae]